MDSYYVIGKEKLTSFLTAVMKEFRLVTPQPASNGDFLLQDTKDLEKISFNYDVTSNTIKQFFLPRREIIFRYLKKTDGEVKITSVQEKIKEDTIFFGVRACDVRAVYFQDCFFAQEPKDVLYWRKRNKGILISIACNKPPHQSCFCTSVHKTGPFLEKNEGFDLQFIDLANAYVVEIGTTKGENLIKKYRRFFTRADKEMQSKKSFLKKNCFKSFNGNYDVLTVYKNLKSLNLNELWEELGKRCTNCGGCEFICPTCYCFYTQDVEYSEKKGDRIRSWDSCTFKGYSRMAGDTNPHEKNSDRISRRFFCKLHNGFNWFKMFGCTGCGRCSFVCPVNLDMESFIASQIEAHHYQPLLKEL
jgi:ferredoxin